MQDFTSLNRRIVYSDFTCKVLCLFDSAYVMSLTKCLPLLSLEFLNTWAHGHSNHNCRSTREKKQSAHNFKIKNQKFHRIWVLKFGLRSKYYTFVKTQTLCVVTKNYASHDTQNHLWTGDREQSLGENPYFYTLSEYSATNEYLAICCCIFVYIFLFSTFSILVLRELLKMVERRQQCRERRCQRWQSCPCQKGWASMAVAE